MTDLANSESTGQTRPQPGASTHPLEVLSGSRANTLTVALRWATIALGITTAIFGNTSLNSHFFTALILLSILALVRTWRPLTADIRAKTEIGLLIEFGIIAVALCISGGWNSPFVLVPFTTIAITGLCWGYIPSFLGALCTSLALTAVGILSSNVDPILQPALQGSMLFVLAGTLGGFTERLTQEAERERQRTHDEFARMGEANELLLALHNVAQTLPASLDRGDVMASARKRLRDLFDFQQLVIMTLDESAGTWQPELADGVRLPPNMRDEDLPKEVWRALKTEQMLLITDYVEAHEVGCSPIARSALIAPLRSRNVVIAIVSIEHSAPNHFTTHDLEKLRELTAPLALSIDNATWFGRIRSLGAEAERNRIARDLHDRLAQALAFIAFELERLEGTPGGNSELVHLRNVVREMLGDLRETLYELRAHVSEEHDLEEVAREYLEKFGDRSGMQVTFASHTEGTRAPIQVEQELWRILQEALTNIERHADATAIQVSWMLSGGRAWLEIKDDGKGFRPDQIRRERFGLLGMRERADAIGGHLQIDSSPGGGTRVLAEVEVAQ